MRIRKEVTASIPTVGAVVKRPDMYQDIFILTNLHASFNKKRENSGFSGRIEWRRANDREDF